MKKFSITLASAIIVLTGALGTLALTACNGGSDEHTHTLTAHDAVAATCTQGGNIAYWSCADCGKNFSDAVGNNEVTDVALPATGHTYESEVTTQPTCTAEGERTYTCTACQGSYTEAIAATGHTAVTDAAVAPTCTETGLTAGSHCSVCNTALVEQQIVAALGHSYASEVTKEPTCTEDGVRTYTCTVCQDSYTEPVTATGHTAVTDAAVAPTCTETGLTEGSHCSVCNIVLEAQQVVEATGHNFVSGVCSVCGTHEPTAGLIYSLSPDGRYYTVTGYTGTAAEVYIPSSYNGIPVTSIGEYAFYAQPSLTGIAIPDSVTSIGLNAFYLCDNIAAVYITDLAAWCRIELDEYSSPYSNPLYYAGDLYLNGQLVTDLVIPDGITEIKAFTFAGCTSLTSVTMPNSVTSIGYGAFAYCMNATSLTIGSSVTSIGAYAFGWCYNLVSVVIPNSVTTIGERAFAFCMSLTSITIGSGVTSIGYYAFENCPKLVEVYNLSALNITPENPDDSLVAYFALNVYTPSSGSSKLSTTSDGYIFYSDENVSYLMGYTGPLTQLTLPNTHTYAIYQFAFYGRNDIISVTIPDHVTSIERDAFADCSSLTNVIIGNGVTNIGYTVFSGCTALTSITIGNSVKSIGYGVFQYCTLLTGVYITDLAAWCEIEFAGYNSNPLYYAGNLYLNGQLVTDLIIPNGVTNIGAYAFYGCDSLTSVTIGNSVTGIWDNAFSHCDSLTSVSIENSVTGIGDRAFYGCGALTSVFIGNGVTSIGDSAFSYCNLLTSIIIGNGVTSIGDSAFSHCTALTSITIPNSVTSIGNGAFSYCSSLISITIPDNVTSIGYEAFAGCNALTNVTFKNPNGWWCSTSPTATSGMGIAGTDLSDPATAARYLTDTYCYYCWKRN